MRTDVSRWPERFVPLRTELQTKRAESCLRGVRGHGMRSNGWRALRRLPTARCRRGARPPSDRGGGVLRCGEPGLVGTIESRGRTWRVGGAAPGAFVRQVSVTANGPRVQDGSCGVFVRRCGLTRGRHSGLLSDRRPSIVQRRTSTSRCDASRGCWRAGAQTGDLAGPLNPAGRSVKRVQWRCVRRPRDAADAPRFARRPPHRAPGGSPEKGRPAGCANGYLTIVNLTF